MRTLTEITNAVRRNEEVTTDELRLAVAAYDVMVAKFNIQQDRQQVEEFFRAAESDPAEYIGWVNNPDNPESVEWHRSQINLDPVITAAKQHLTNEEESNDNGND